jgi:hypothetical protein
MKGKSVLFGLIALLASLVPAFAGEVYVPFASNKLINGSLYQTRVWVTNASTAVRSCDVRFIEEDTDGTKPGTKTTLNVPAGVTMVVTNVAPSGKSGILEVSGAPQLTVTSRLDVFAPNGDPAATLNVPVVSTGNVIAAGKTAEIQGLEQTQRGTTTDFGLLNLNRSAAQCTVKAYRANASQISQTVVLTLQPLSVRHFDGALTSLGAGLVSDVRIDVSCDKQFFPYSLVYKPGASEAAFVTPSQTLEGDLVPDGSTPPPTGGSVVVQQDGVFLAAKQGASYKQVTIPLVNGVQYRKATMEFDLQTGRFPQGLFAGITSFRRNDRTLFFGMIIRGDREKTLLDMGVTDDIVQGPNGGPWKENTKFHVWYEYDTQTRVLTFKCYLNGNLVQTLTGRTNHNDLSLNGKVVSIDFGMTGIADGAYFPPIGWTYSNLKVVVEPQ